MIMATFAQWLADQEGRPEEDPTGQLARLWKQFEGNRPRVSSPTGIQRWLLGSQVEGADELIQAAVAEYHAKRGDLRVASAGETAMLEEVIRRQDEIIRHVTWIASFLRLAFDLTDENAAQLGLEPAPAWAETAAVQYAGEDGQAVVQQLPMTAAAEAAAAEARAISARVLAGQLPIEAQARAAMTVDGPLASENAAVALDGWQQLWDLADHTAEEAQ